MRCNEHMKSHNFLDFNSEEVDPMIKKAFWGAVEDCLVEIHKLERADAHQKREDLRRRIESPPPGLSSVLIYHDPPFYLACDIVEKPSVDYSLKLLLKGSYF